MSINIKKSVCLRIGPRFDAECSDIVTSTGHVLPWVREIRYLGVFILCGRHFKCSSDNAKRSFYRAANSIFGKIGRSASEEVVLQLITTKCLPILLYGLEACPVNKSDKLSLDFCVNRLLMKLFKSSNFSFVTECRQFFGFKLPSELLQQRTDKFISQLVFK